MFVYRNAVPLADFYATNVCFGKAVQFQDSSSVSGGTVSTWFCELGNGDTTSVQNPSVNYTTSGTYSVTLHITEGIGCEDSITKTVVVNPLPVADFTILSACDYDSVRFTDASIGNIISYSWSFGDSTIATTQNAVHLYTDSLSFIVTHTIMCQWLQSRFPLISFVYQ
jgi:PKD repeat protein